MRDRARLSQKLSNDRREDGTSIFLDGATHLETTSGVAPNPLGADSLVGTLSIWFNPLNVAGQKFLFDFDNPPILELALEGSRKLSLFATRDIGGSAFAVGSVDSFTLDGRWKHGLWSWNNEAGSEDVQVLLNGIDNAPAPVFNSAGPLGWSAANGTIKIGMSSNLDRRFQGFFGEIWLDTTTQLDFTDINNVRKFISEDGRRVDLGPGGTRPLGTQPHLYYSSRHRRGVSGFQKSRGAYPDLDVVVGASFPENHIGNVIRAKGRV